jgi:hypothetical protein
MSIPPRMTFPFAHHVARAGHDVRRIGWTDKWWRYRGGIWFVVSGGVQRVAEAADITEADILAWDWTTAPVDCDLADGPVDPAVLLTVRPFDGTAPVSDPFGQGCALPELAPIETQTFPSLTVPPVDADGVLVRADAPDPLLLPSPPKGPEWLPMRRQRRETAAPPPVDPVPDPALVFAWTLNTNLPDYLGYVDGSACVEPVYVIEDGVTITIYGGGVQFTGGAAGSNYLVTIGLEGSVGVITEQWWQSTIAVGVLVSWTVPPQFSAKTLAIGEQISVLATWEKVGGGASGSSSKTVLIPSVCGGVGSGQ